MSGRTYTPEEIMQALTMLNSKESEPVAKPKKSSVSDRRMIYRNSMNKSRERRLNKK